MVFPWRPCPGSFFRVNAKRNGQSSAIGVAHAAQLHATRFQMNAGSLASEHASRPVMPLPRKLLRTIKDIRHSRQWREDFPLELSPLSVAGRGYRMTTGDFLPVSIKHAFATSFAERRCDLGAAPRVSSRLDSYPCAAALNIPRSTRADRMRSPELHWVVRHATVRAWLLRWLHQHCRPSIRVPLDQASQ